MSIGGILDPPYNNSQKLSVDNLFGDHKRPSAPRTRKRFAFILRRVFAP